MGSKICVGRKMLKHSGAWGAKFLLHQSSAACGGGHRRGARSKQYCSNGEKLMRMILVIAMFVFSLFLVESGRAQAPFYQGKTITVILGGPPAGSADLRTRGVINILRKHIPGNPTIVMQYIGAGGGRQAANHVYGVAKPDGLTVGSMGAALVT